MSAIHHRMPVILPLKAVADWLAPDTEPATVTSLLGAIDDRMLRMWPVSSRVNRAANDDPGLLEEIALPPNLGLAGA